MFEIENFEINTVVVFILGVGLDVNVQKVQGMDIVTRRQNYNILTAKAVKV